MTTRPEARPSQRRHRPRIGILNPASPARGADPLGGDLPEAVREAGGAVVRLPTESQPSAKTCLDRIAGLLVAGPEVELRLHAKGWTLPSAGRHASTLLGAAHRRGIPLLAIGGGMQLLNLAVGGSLYTELGLELPEAIDHVQRGELRRPSHSVNVRARTLLAEAIGEGMQMVNSRHQRAVKRLGPGWTAAALALDGVVEAIECSEERWAVGVQWHPESLLASAPANLGLFRAFVKAAAGWSR
jgi:putative glutamine amidotransferase